MPGSFELFVGTLDGRTTLHVRRSLPASARLWEGRGSLPSASGPFGGKVLYWTFDGSRSELHVVDAASGRDDTVVTTGNVVYNAVYEPLSKTVLFGQLEAGRRHDLGVWRVPANGGQQASQVLPPVSGHAYSGPREWARYLMITPDGSRFVVRDCQDAKCGVDIYATSDMGLLASADTLRDDAVFGLTDDALVGILGCAAGACGVSEIDLASGLLRSLTDDRCSVSGTGVIATRVDGSPVLLVATPAGCGAAGGVSVVDLSTGAAVPAWTPTGPDAATGAVLSLAVQEQGYQGYATPEGWFLVAPNAELARTNQTGSLMPKIVSLSGGSAFTLSVQPAP